MHDQRRASPRPLEAAPREPATADPEDAAAGARERKLRRSPLDADAKLGLAAPQDGVVQTIAAVAGQSVAAGTVLLEISATQSLWVRVPLAPAELDRFARASSVQVMRLGSTGPGMRATPIDAPPSADPVAATVDLFYALPAADADFRPGERVAVELGYATDEQTRSVPASAVVADFDGGTWVYECVDDGAFRRRRVEVLARDGDVTLLRRAPAVGTCVVSVGALELLGVELGVAH
jgi:multidrug efflux pump subunit AcrA (membrane-fusion protein)